MRTVTLIPGDGIGPEVTAAARTRVALKGPMGNTIGGDFRVRRRAMRASGRVEERSYPGPTIALRGELELFANVRPTKSYEGIASRYRGIDMVLFRENSEDLYVGDERMVDENTAEAIKRITVHPSARMARFAADYMRRTGRRRVTIGHKTNVLKLTDGLFLKTCRETLGEFPDLEFDDRIVDALCMELVLRPERFDCVLLPNLYGDMLSDLAAGLVGGLGVAPGANIGNEHAMFEAVHGTAPDIAGQDVANPASTILSAVMMLRYVGEGAAADRIDRALAAVLRAGKRVTRDLGGSAGTQEMARAVVEELAKA
jgi:isocitrate dehydrogenase (NAD+)